MISSYRRVIAAAALLGAGLLGTACGGGGGAAETSRSQGASGDGGGGGVVARVGDREITLAEIDRVATSTSMKAYQDLFDARSQALEEMIADRLLEQEAQARGVTQEQLVTQEISGKIKPVTDADVEAFYNQNQAQMRGQSLEQIGGQIRTFLVNQYSAAATGTFIGQLREKAGVETFLEPPRVEVTIAANDPTIGPPDARVTIVEYSDFQ